MASSSRSACKICPSETMNGLLANAYQSFSLLFLSSAWSKAILVCAASPTFVCRNSVGEFQNTDCSIAMSEISAIFPPMKYIITFSQRCHYQSGTCAHHTLQNQRKLQAPRVRHQALLLTLVSRMSKAILTTHSSHHADGRSEQ